jgi:hypothetical protein
LKSLSIKIPIEIAQLMDDNAEYNPNWLTGFLVLNYSRKAPEAPLTGLNMNYTFKIDEGLHKAVKLAAIENNLPINEFVGRLLVTHYKVEV